MLSLSTGGSREPLADGVSSRLVPMRGRVTFARRIRASLDDHDRRGYKGHDLASFTERASVDQYVNLLDMRGA